MARSIGLQNDGGSTMALNAGINRQLNGVTEVAPVRHVVVLLQVTLEDGRAHEIEGPTVYLH